MSRPKGSKNHLNQTVKDTAYRLGINVFEIICLFAMDDWEALGYESSVMICEKGDGKGTFMRYTITPELRLEAAKAAAKYLYSPVQPTQATPDSQDKSVEAEIEEMKKKHEELDKM